MRQKNKRPQKSDAPKKLTAFERETQRRRREMLRILGERVEPIKNKRLKSLAWRDAPKGALKIMRAKPTRRAPKGT